MRNSLKSCQITFTLLALLWYTPTTTSTTAFLWACKFSLFLPPYFYSKNTSSDIFFLKMYNAWMKNYCLDFRSDVRIFYNFSLQLNLLGEVKLLPIYFFFFKLFNTSYCCAKKERHICIEGDINNSSCGKSISY